MQIGQQTYPFTTAAKTFLLEVSKGNVEKHSLVNKFGAGLLTTSLLPVSQDNEYPTPTTAISLEFLSSSADDTSAGTGAREVTVVGLNSAWAEVSQTVVTNGVTPVALTTPLIRLYRWYVSQSGTYATELSGSHAGTLTLRVAGAGATWSTITTTPFPVGQSQIGIYTVPLGYTGYLLAKNVFADTTKTADIYFFQRPNANDVTAPFTGTMRLFEREVGVTGGYQVMPPAPKGPFVGPCDVGFMGKVSAGTSECSVEFQLLLIQD